MLLFVCDYDASCFCENLLSKTATTKYRTTKRRLIPHNRCTDPLGSAAHEENTCERIPSPMEFVASDSAMAMLFDFGDDDDSFVFLSLS